MTLRGGGQLRFGFAIWFMTGVCAGVCCGCGLDVWFLMIVSL